MLSKVRLEAIVQRIVNVTYVCAYFPLRKQPGQANGQDTAVRIKLDSLNFGSTIHIFRLWKNICGKNDIP